MAKLARLGCIRSSCQRLAVSAFLLLSVSSRAMTKLPLIFLFVFFFGCVCSSNAEQKLLLDRLKKEQLEKLLFVTLDIAGEHPDKTQLNGFQESTCSVCSCCCCLTGTLARDRTLKAWSPKPAHGFRLEWRNLFDFLLLVCFQCASNLCDAIQWKEIDNLLWWIEASERKRMRRKLGKFVNWSS